MTIFYKIKPPISQPTTFFFKIHKRNISIYHIYQDLNVGYKKKIWLETNISILLKSNNQNLIVLIYNLVFYFKIKHINI